MKAAYTSLMTTTSLLNCCLNYLLGELPFEDGPTRKLIMLSPVYGPDVIRVGYKGAAMSTSISYIIAVVLALLRLLVRRDVPHDPDMTDMVVAPRPSFPQAFRKLILLGFGGIGKDHALSLCKLSAS